MFSAPSTSSMHRYVDKHPSFDPTGRRATPSRFQRLVDKGDADRLAGGRGAQVCLRSYRSTAANKAESSAEVSGRSFPARWSPRNTGPIAVRTSR
jgi:hypothetical protein